ncbi:MAG: hypothetical protein AAF456_21685 [Planctomycetota bacterium]
MRGTATSAIHVLKFGGSLFQFEEGPERLRGIIQQLNRRCVIVCGGGAAVDEIRLHQKDMGLSDQHAHWKAVGIVDENTRRICKAIQTPVETTFEGNRPLPFGFLCHDWLKTHGPIPESWASSSDSIAAVVAGGLSRTSGKEIELSLLKSTLPDINEELDTQEVSIRLAEQGFVDEFFPKAIRVAQIEKLRIVDVRRQKTLTFSGAPGTSN